MRRTALCFAFLLVAACNTDPAKDKVKAEVKEAVATASAPAPASAQKYVFSQDGSKIEWVGAKVTKKHDGAFTKFTGTVTLPASGEVTQGSVTVDVDTASVTSDAEKLTGHLKSPDFFDVEKFPKATFESTSIQANGGAYTITGNLDLHGVKKSITFPATIRSTPDGVEVDAEFAINRKDFNIVYPGMPDDLIKDEVLLKLAIRAKKA